MQPRLQEIQEFITLRRRDLLGAVDGVPPGTSPPSGWSVAAIVDHLRATEEGISKLLHVTVSRIPEAARKLETETSSVLHSLDHQRLLDRTRKMRAPVTVQPRTDVGLPDALAGLQESRVRLLKTITEVDGVALGTYSYPHPAFGVLDLYQWLVFLGAHETRHAAQIRELGASRVD